MAKYNEILPRRHQLLAIAATIAAIVAVVGMQVSPPKLVASESAVAALQETITDVKRRWPNLQHMSTEDVASSLVNGEVVLFDARSVEEYAVSHLSGAIRVPADISRGDFLALHGDKVKDKLAVFYCAVGVRSSTVASKVADALVAGGARRVVNMAGGIFAWHNQKRPLVDVNGATQAVHSYDAWWGRMVARPERIRMAP